MKASELRVQSVDELDQEQNSQLEKQFKLRIQRATGQLSQTHQVRETRRNIARIKTALNEKAGN